MQFSLSFPFSCGPFDQLRQSDRLAGQRSTMSPYAGSRQRVLQLYRQIMKLGRGWGHSGEEQRYIFKEAQQAFKGNKTTSEALDIDEQASCHCSDKLTRHLLLMLSRHWRQR